MAASGNPISEASTTSTLWLPGSALHCYESSLRLRDWLLTPGLLTERIRSAAGDRFSMRVLCENAHGDEHLREIVMCCELRIWLFAQTRIPSNTLLLHPWLGHIGNNTLGAALAKHSDTTRSDFSYSRLLPDTQIIADALRHSALPSQALWVRRSEFSVARAPFSLYEVFIPTIGEC